MRSRGRRATVKTESGPGARNSMLEGGAMFGSAMAKVLWCWLTMSVLVLTVCSGDDDSNLSDTVRTLKGQVTALLERRQEDFRLLEESLRRSLEKNSLLASLKEEVDTLRREMEALRGGPAVRNQQKNDHLTVQWLASSVSELRAELSELSASHNASAELQRHEETRTELSLLRSDVASTRRDMDELRAQVATGAATLAQAQEDAIATRAQAQNAAASCADTRAQLQTAQSEWTITLRALRKSAKTSKLFKSMERPEEDNNLDPTGPAEHKYRHHRALRLQVSDLESSTQKLREGQTALGHSMRRLEKQVKSLQQHSNHVNGGGEVAARQLQGRVANLEQASRNTAKSMFNLTRQLVGLDKLHLSMLQLLESVETLENKVDRSLPDLQREISKMEFNMAQTASTVALLKEDQENQRSSLKAMSEGASAMQEMLDTDHGRLSVIQAQVLNLTMCRSQLDSRLTQMEHDMQTLMSHRGDVGATLSAVSINSTEQEQISEQEPFNSSSVSQLVQELTHFQQEYQGIVRRLPHDCKSVRGPTGLYILAPGGEGTSPMSAWCDQDTNGGGWTVIQRRVDGSQDFNRKWNEYATGFGSPTGEFWLGNEALHQLTGDNCSSLRVDLRDIYGKIWVAEYGEWSISDAEDGYRMHAASYRGNASDALEYQNRMQFSAIDVDRDISNTHCAANYEGGWWFSHCQHANLNGRYNLGLTWFDASKNEWIAVAWSEMKVRRRDGCEPPHS